MYCDVEDTWSFNSNGDLNLTDNYGESIKHRVFCPLNYLNIYYDKYGSTLYKQLGENFNKEIIRNEIDFILKQDVNVKYYEIIDISFDGFNLVIKLLINEDDIVINYKMAEEKVEENVVIKQLDIYVNTLILQLSIYKFDTEMNFNLIDLLDLDFNTNYRYEVIDYKIENNQLILNINVNDERKNCIITLFEEGE